MDTDRNLLFGVLALQTELLQPAQLSGVFRDFLEKSDSSLGDFLVARGLLTPDDLVRVEGRVQEVLDRHGGDPRAALNDLDPKLLHSLAEMAEPTLLSVAGLILPPAVDRGTANIPPLSQKAEDKQEKFPSGAERYRRLGKHAAGGIGQIWLARDQNLDRDVALKELRPEKFDNSELRRRFLDEARITGQLDHPGIVPVYEMGRTPESGQPFYIMRFVKGRTLSDDIRVYHHLRQKGKAGALELNALLGAFINICNALAYAHSRGIIHRDLKGANIVLGDFGEVMVLDWGLAKRLDEKEQPTPVASGQDKGEVPGAMALDQTQKGQVLGTPAYMAPEQAAGGFETIDHRADVYGLGAILYEILTGQAPFAYSREEVPDVYEILRLIRVAEPTRPRERNPSVPRALEAICLRALAKKPADRYPGAAALAQDVTRFLADEPVSAYREPLSSRLSRWARRHKPLVAAAGALVCAAAIALAVSTLLISQEQARTRAMAEKAQENFSQARSVVDRFFIKVSEDRLLKEPGMQRLRIELLTMAKKYYQDFERAHQDDPDVKLDLGKTLYYLAKVNLALGDASEAIKNNHLALETFTSLVKKSPGQREFRFYLGKCFNLKGIIFLGKKSETAEEAFLQARDIFANMFREDPGDLEAAEFLGHNQGNLGAVFRNRKKFVEALAAFRKSLEIYQGLVNARPSHLPYLDDLAGSHTNLGYFLWYFRKERDPAEKHFLDALDIHQKLVKLDPNNFEYQSYLAKSYLSLARFYRGGDKSQEKIPLFTEKALTLRKGVADNNPSVTAYQAELADAYLEWSVVEPVFEKKKEAILKARDIYQALVRRHPGDLSFKAGLGWSWETEGNLVFETDKKAARPIFLQVLATLEPVLTEDPNSYMARKSLHNAYWGLAVIETAGGDATKTLEFWKKADRLDEGRNDSFREEMKTSLRTLLNRAKNLAMMKNFEQAARAADSLSQWPRLADIDLATLGLIFVDCAEGALAAKNSSLARARADQAVALFERAHAEGFFRAHGVQLLLAVNQSPCFQRHPAFQKLLKNASGKN